MAVEAGGARAAQVRLRALTSRWTRRKDLSGFTDSKFITDHYYGDRLYLTLLATIFKFTLIFLQIGEFIIKVG